MSDNNDIKLQIMKLWEDTFHDTDEYIKLVFDNYFNPELVEYKVENGEVLAAMLGVPYYFDMKPDKVNNKENGKLKGLYLCGLATKPECRKRGYMSRLIEDINQRAFQLDFDFSFLIPADGSLKKYYSDRGYVESFYRVKENYLSCHNFENEYYQELMKSAKFNIHDINRRLDNFNSLKVYKLNPKDENEVDELVEFIKSSEENSRLLSIRHSPQDIKVAIKECYVSDGEIMMLKNDKNQVVAAAFIDFETDAEIQRLIKKYDNTEPSKSIEKDTTDYLESRKEGRAGDIKHSMADRVFDLNNIINIKDAVTRKTRIENDDIGISSFEKSERWHHANKIRYNESGSHSSTESSRTTYDDISILPNIKTVNIKAVFYTGMCEKYRLLEAVARRYGSAEQLTVVNTAACNRNSAIWRPMFIGEKSIASPVGMVDNIDAPFSSSQNAESHGMIRLLNPLKILKFLCASSETFKNEILAVDSILQNEIKITTKAGNYLVNLPFVNENLANISAKQEFKDVKNTGESPLENCKSTENSDSSGFITVTDREWLADATSEVGIFPVLHPEISENAQPVRISLQQLAEMLFSALNEQKVVCESLGIPSQYTFISLMLD